MKSNGIKINNQNIDDEKFIISKNIIDKNKFFKLSIGKKDILKL